MNANNKNNAQLALFTFTAPTLLPGLGLKEKKGENGETTSIVLSLEKRKEIGRLASKSGDALTAHILGLTDAVKEYSIGEFAKMAASPEWTGGSMRITRSKNGKQRATMSLVSANRETKTISADQLAKALANMSEEEQAALLEQAEELKKSLAVTDVQAETSEAAAPAAA